MVLIYIFLVAAVTYSGALTYASATVRGECGALDRDRPKSGHRRLEVRAGRSK